MTAESYEDKEGNDKKAPESPGSEANSMYSNEEVEKIIQARLKQERSNHEKREAEYSARIADLEKKVNAGTATTDEKIQHQQAKNTEEQAQASGIPPEAIPFIVEQQRKNVEFQQKMSDAIEKDQEFKKLSETGNAIPGFAISEMMHLDNAPAVIKHLLKDKKDHKLMEATIESGSKSDFIRFVNDLSSRLESKKPHPSPYTPAPDVSDIGDSDQDFDIKGYIDSKY